MASSDNFELLRRYFLEHGFVTNRKFTAHALDEFIHDPSKKWFTLDMTSIYRRIHERFNGNRQSLADILKRLGEPDNFDVHRHVVGISSLFLLYVYVMLYCQSRCVEFETPYIQAQLDDSFNSIVHGTYTHHKVTNEPIWEDALCETMLPTFTIMDCVEYWLQREAEENKDHPLTPFIDLDLIRRANQQ